MKNVTTVPARLWNTARPDLATALLRLLWLLLWLHFAHAVCWLFLRFPDAYSWGEAFIKYTDGPMRRGLVGSVLHTLEPWISARYVWTLTSAALTGVFLCKGWELLRRSFTPLCATALFFSPGIFAFLVRDSDLMGRKDIVVLALLVASMHLAIRAISGRMPPAPAVALALGCWVPAFLTHEIALFFLPLPAILLVRAVDAPLWKNPCVYIIPALCALGLWFALRFPGTVEMQKTMFAQWQALIPQFTTPGGMRFVGQSLQFNLADTARYWAAPSLVLSCVKAWALALAPVALLFATYRFHHIHKAVMGTLLSLCAYLGALLTPVALTVLINDFGRVIAYSCLMFTVYAALVFRLYAAQGRALPRRPWSDGASLDDPRVALATLLYAVSWKLWHYTSLTPDPTIVHTAF